jgi:hypothetical protein
MLMIKKISTENDSSKKKSGKILNLYENNF